MIEENSREVGNAPGALNIWWNLHILRDDGIAKSRIYRFYWISACVGMTKRFKITIGY